jgi:beta-N-acetylhexosaminidase
MDTIKNIINNMTLEQKIGQLFIVAFPSNDVSKISPLIKKYQIGGCYISDDNAKTFNEAKLLSSKLQELSQSYNKNLPLLLGVDQEGSWCVLSKESTIGAGNLALGSVNDVKLTKKMYSLFSAEMNNVGYNCILGPSCDINLDIDNQIIGTRAFGETSTLVSAHVKASIQGINENGCISTAKHFPGHGDTKGDSHREIPIVDKSKEELFKNELLPFQEAIDAGVDMIMTSHILYPAFDKKYPATLSYKILTSLLKNKMGFNGLIITDSMNMGAIRKYYSIEEASVLALKAGADFIMLSEEHYDHNKNYLENQIKSIESIINEVKNNNINISIINKKLEKIIKFKQKRILDNHIKSIQLSKKEKIALEQEISFKAIKILKNNSNLFPLSKYKKISLVNATPKTSYNNIVNIRGIGPNQKINAFDEFSKNVHKLCLNISIYNHEQINIQEISKSDIIIIITEDYPLPGEDFNKIEQVKTVQKFIELFNSKLLLIGFRSPYELQFFPNIQNYVCAYSSRLSSVKAMIDFIHF